MPGCDKLELTGENQYEGVLNIKVGPVQGRFQGKVELENLNPPNGYLMKVGGQGAPGFVKASAEIQIVGDGDKTRLIYDGEMSRLGVLDEILLARGQRGCFCNEFPCPGQTALNSVCILMT